MSAVLGEPEQECFNAWQFYMEYFGVLKTQRVFLNPVIESIKQSHVNSSSKAILRLAHDSYLDSISNQEYK